MAAAACGLRSSASLPRWSWRGPMDCRFSSRSCWQGWSRPTSWRRQPTAGSSTALRAWSSPLRSRRPFGDDWEQPGHPGPSRRGAARPKLRLAPAGGHKQPGRSHCGRSPPPGCRRPAAVRGGRSRPPLPIPPCSDSGRHPRGTPSAGASNPGGAAACCRDRPSGPAGGVVRAGGRARRTGWEPAGRPGCTSSRAGGRSVAGAPASSEANLERARRLAGDNRQLAVEIDEALCAVLVRAGNAERVGEVGQRLLSQLADLGGPADAGAGAFVAGSNGHRVRRLGTSPGSAPPPESSRHQVALPRASTRSWPHRWRSAKAADDAVTLAERALTTSQSDGRYELACEALAVLGQAQNVSVTSPQRPGPSPLRWHWPSSTA